ncbi:MAG: CBS domain-containing protein [Desulfuromonas sp.]|uniref:CBS domain-containing protein n=1 Tax=Desulfuromonas sp. TaxID=892 RepID=UPI000CC203FB|nr:CBS domain-containing protein [Desulfuromonas sp.]PLX84298.1 MAG: CBS domain-containing protein [Desulfuromonas sp.]
MIVGEVCSREVVYVERDATILEAARVMRSNHVGDVVVADKKNGGCMPVGILTDRDIVIELLAAEVDLDSVSVGDAMSYELLMAREGDDLLETVKLMRNRGVRRVPVIDRGGLLVGIVSVDDVVELLSEQLTDLVKLVAVEERREREHRA